MRRSVHRGSLGLSRISTMLICTAVFLLLSLSETVNARPGGGLRGGGMRRGSVHHAAARWQAPKRSRVGHGHPAKHTRGYTRRRSAEQKKRLYNAAWHRNAAVGSYYYDDYYDEAYIAKQNESYVESLPENYETVDSASGELYYAEGVYYRSSGDGYIEKKPPVGTIVPSLPAHTVVHFEETDYYFAGGIYYIQVEKGYKIVVAPMGITVAELPPGVSILSLGEVKYYVVENVYYKRCFEDGEVAYKVVPGLS